MAGANWTRKDYQQLAELCADILDTEVPPERHAWVLQKFAGRCFLNAKFDINGNRNFNATRFAAEVKRLMKGETE